MWADAEVPKPPILRGKNPWDPMSAMSHKRTFKCVRTMSALPPKADIKLVSVQRNNSGSLAIFTAIRRASIN
jgi:hypothetical protein